MLLKAGTYVFNEILNFDYILQDETTNFYTEYYNFTFSLPPITRSVTQSEADALNQFLSDNGYSGEPLVVGTYTLYRSYQQMWLEKAVSNSGYDYRLAYDNGVTIINPSSEALMAVARTNNEVYYSFLSSGTHWQNSVLIPDFRTVIFDNDIIVSKNFGLWFISNTNYNEVNAPVEDIIYIEKSSWYKSVSDAIRNKKGTTAPILRDNFASEIESISVGEEPPYFDGTVIIEKAESVLGLRKFKESVTPITYYFDKSNDTEVTNAFMQYGFTIEPISVTRTEEGVTGVVNIMGISCILDYNDSPTDVTQIWYGEVIFDNVSQGIMYLTTDTDITEFNVLETPNTTVDEWLLANTEEVSV